MAGKTGNLNLFTEKYPEHPAKPLSSIQEILDSFNSKSPLAFYYPSVPHL